MKISISNSISMALAALLLTIAFGQSARAENKLSEIADKVSLNGQVRVRPEFRHNLSQALPAVPGAREEDLSVLLRSRLGLAFDPTKRLLRKRTLILLFLGPSSYLERHANSKKCYL